MIGATAVGLVAVAALTAVGLAAPGPDAGSILAFGFNFNGQLGNTSGNGAIAPNPTPALVPLPGEIGPVTQVAVGAGHSLVVTSSGQLYAFGDNQYGELGSPGNSGTTVPNPTAAVVTLPGEVGTATQAAADVDLSLTVTSSGQLYSFGTNLWGQLGRSANVGTMTATPTPAPIDLPGQVGPVTQAAAGSSHGLALTASGQVYSFGRNDLGQLGRTANATANPVAALVTLPGAVGPVTQVAAGGDHSLALTSSGQLYAFGDNQYGELGATANSGTATPNPTPAPVALPGQVGTITQVAAGSQHTLVVTSSGQLYAFGDNNFGELGTTANNMTDSANPTPPIVTLPGEIGPVTQVAAGSGHSLAVTSSGQLYAFGYNESGELGSATNNNATSPNPVPATVALPAGTTIDAVAKGGGAGHSIALVSDLAISSAALLSGQAGTPYADVLQATGGTAPLHWSAQGLPGGVTIDAANGALTGTPSAPGGFSPTITLTDSYGSSVSRAFTLTVAAAAPAVAPAPRLTGLKQSASRWLPGGKLPRLTSTTTTRRGGLPVGTTFTVVLDQAARLALTFRHTAAGRKVAGKCVAKTRGNARKSHCTRAVVDGIVHLQAAAGTNRVHFEGRLSRTRKLKPGRFSVTIKAVGPTGKTSAAKSLHFSIVAG